jgi:hypothetical protein
MMAISLVMPMLRVCSGSRSIEKIRTVVRLNKISADFAITKRLFIMEVWVVYRHTQVEWLDGAGVVPWNVVADQVCGALGGPG